jgi:hypothetical protein
LFSISSTFNQFYPSKLFVCISSTFLPSILPSFILFPISFYISDL